MCALLARERLQLSTCEVDLDELTVSRSGEIQSLTPMEAAALAYLVDRQGQVVAREDLERDVWGFAEGVESQTVAVCLRRLRSKIEGNPRAPEHLRTVRGVGWVFRAAALGGGGPPAPRDAFIGRRTELDDLLARVGGTDRLVTVVGPGGVGKTRLVLQVAHEAAPRFTKITFFDLRDARSTADICAVVARALGVPLDVDGPVGQLGWALRQCGATLHLFDNLEGCASLLHATLDGWVDQARDGRFLCTSRVPTGLKGERLVRLHPLPQTDAVALFLDRAPVPVPAEHLDHVRALVGVVDGLPLAVELAASRVGLLPLPQLQERMGLHLLRGVQGSLEASLEGTRQLLSEPAREALAALTVFEGGFDLEAAEAVLEGGESVLDVLQELVDASLLRVDPRTSRFSMLPLVHEFAAARLDRPAVAELRHGIWFALLDRHPDPADLENLAVACRRAVARRDGNTAADCAVAAWRICKQRGPVSTGLELIELALGVRGHAGAPALVEARLDAMWRLGRGEEALSAARDGLALARSRVDRATEGRLHSFLGGRLALEGHPEQAAVHCDQALTIFAAIGDRGWSARVYANLGNLHHSAGRADEAVRYYEQALSIFRELGVPDREAITLHNLGVLMGRSGRRGESRRHLERALALHRRSGDLGLEALTLQALASEHHESGHPDEARRMYKEALQIQRRVGVRAYEATVLSNLANVESEQSHMEEARRLYEAALAIDAEIGATLHEAQARTGLGTLCLMEGNLDEGRRHLEAAIEQLRSAGDAAQHGERAREAIAVGNLGIVHLLQGRLDEARSCFERALTHHRQFGEHRFEGIALTNLARLHHLEGRREQAQELLDEAMDRIRQGGDPRIEAGVLEVRARMWMDQGDLDAARSCLEASVDRSRGLGDLTLVGAQCTTRGRLQALEGQLDAAVVSLVEAERHLRTSGSREQLTRLLCVLAEVCSDEAALAQARVLAGQLGAGPRSALGSRIARLAGG